MTRDGRDTKGTDRGRPVPFFNWRGLMLDCARHFWPAPLLVRVLEEVALSGGNRLHLHLTDDQGWRLPLPGRPGLGGACYTADELKGLVARGRELGVEILPEVDLPGHCGALLAALPGLSCSGLPRSLPTAWGCHEALLCLGRPQALEFLDEVLATLVEIFPFPLVHLGGDEVTAGIWERCPHCRELARREGLEGTAALPGWWLRQAAERLARAGRRGAFWDEALDGSAPPGSLILAWRPEAVRRALEAGHETVACPQRPCYLDHYAGLEAGQPRAIGGHNDWSALRAFDPLAGCADLPPARRALLLGGQGNLWTEYVDSEELLMERLQPRLAALLEALAQGPDACGDFFRRLPDLLVRQKSRGWTPRVDPPQILGLPMAPAGQAMGLYLRTSLRGARLGVETGPHVEVTQRAFGSEALALRLRRLTDAPGEARLVVCQELPGGLASRAECRLRWEVARPAPASVVATGTAGSPVCCTWLVAATADWRAVRECSERESWCEPGLDWPVERVRQRLALGPPAADDEAIERAAPATPFLPELAPPPSGWGLRRATHLLVRDTGVWSFRLATHDLARLWLDGELLIDQDGFRPGGFLEGHAALAAGRHALRLDWLHLRGGGCRLEARAPGGADFHSPECA